MTYILPVLYVIVSYTFFLLAGCFDNAIKLQILSILLPFIMGIVNLIVVLTVGRKCRRDLRHHRPLRHRRKKVVEKNIAELHFDYQVWTDPVLPDRREHHRICNADGILSIAADGVVWIGNHCFFDFWIRDSIRGSSLCYRLSDKVMQRRHSSEMVGGFSWNLPVLLFL